ncbi:MAG: amino acid ABC transporter permease [Actinobacteria bacterium]|nr:amino acid ABC transporter permease [Actinomycetota bacterium]
MSLGVERLTPPDRGIRYFMAQQNGWSWASFWMGIGTLVMVMLGTLVVLTAHGWTQFCPEGAKATECSPTDPLAEGLMSRGLGLVIIATVILGVATWVISVISMRVYQTKPAKEATLVGIVLAAQGVGFAGFLMWFRGSDVDRFARNFLDVRLIGDHIGLVWSKITAQFGAIAEAAVPWAINMAIAGLLVWIVWRMVVSDNPVAEPIRTVLLAGTAAIVLGLLLDVTGLLTGNLAWLRITERIGEVNWGTLLGTGSRADHVDGLAQGIGSLLRFAALWLGYGAFAGICYRILRGDWRSDEHIRGAVRAMLILAGSGYVIGIVKGMVVTATLPSFAAGAWNTLILSVAGAAIGFGGGLVLSLFAMSSRAVVRAPARIYINFFRGTPLIWQISFAGMGIVPALHLNISPYWVAIMVLGLNLAAYSAEVYRAGIQSIERGQMEASRTLGLSYMQSLQYVVVPQAIRRVIPPLLNEFVILIKDTSLVSILGLTLSQKELLGVGRTIYSSTFDATAWLGAAAGFLIITLPMIRIVTIVERRMRSGLTSVI